MLPITALLHDADNRGVLDNRRAIVAPHRPFSWVSNVNMSDNNIIAGATRVVAERLPPGWIVERVGATSRGASLRISSGEGRVVEVPVSALARADPRSARRIPAGRPLLVVAAYLTRSVREVLEAEGVSYADQTGNVRIVVDEPGLYIVTHGADANPWPEARQFSLRGAKAGRVVCALACSTPPIGVRELAAAAGTASLCIPWRTSPP